MDPLLKYFRMVFSGHWIFVAISVMALSGCVQEAPPITCADTDFQCIESQAVTGIRIVRQLIDQWSRINLAGQVVIVLSGMIATVMIALQGDANKYWTRPVGLVATALVTATTSALVSFHVEDNIDKLVDMADQLQVVTNNFDYKAAKLKAGKSDKEINESFSKDEKFRAAVNDLTFQFATDYNKIRIGLLRLRGTASRLNSISSAPPSVPNPPTEKR